MTKAGKEEISSLGLRNAHHTSWMKDPEREITIFLNLLPFRSADIKSIDSLSDW